MNLARKMIVFMTAIDGDFCTNLQRLASLLARLFVRRPLLFLRLNFLNYSRN